MATFLATYDFLFVSMVLAAVLALTLYLPLMAPTAPASTALVVNARTL